MHDTFRIDESTGLLVAVRQVLSPHFDARPSGVAASLIIIHGISVPTGDFGGPWIDQLFTGNLRADAHADFAAIAALRVSAHALIRRDGTVTQYVPFHQRAWHAGKSSFEGRERCNDFSIGIELEGCDQLAYTDAQYRSLSGLIQALCATYAALSSDRIAGHSEVAPGRKTDPGPAFDWPRLRQLI
jgi:N-acetyl-anhydromuramoyl-L-alanine amidase